MKKLSILNICVFLLMLALCGCQKKERQDDAASSDANVLSDRVLLQNILPGLEDVEKTCWIEKMMGNPDVVGPTITEKSVMRN